MIESIGEFRDTNRVFSFVCYDWKNEIDIYVLRKIIDSIAEIIGSKPDVVTIWDDDLTKDYRYSNFDRLNVMGRRAWLGISYLWKRREDEVSSFSIEAVADLSPRMLSVHVDEMALSNVTDRLEEIVDLFLDRVKPIYGIGYSFPYFWGPDSFACGLISSIFSAVDMKFHGPPPIMRERSLAFGPVFRNPDRSILRDTMRDIFEFNLLSERHLIRRVFQTTLREWIVENSVGVLRQLDDRTWAWEVPESDIDRVRTKLATQGVTIVKR